MYIILEGQALVTTKLLGVETLHLATLETGGFCGEISLIKKEPCVATVIANTDIKCLLITQNYFDILSSSFPEIKYKISKAILEEVCKRLRIAHTDITKLITHSNMASMSFFNNIIQSLTTSEIITLEQTHIDLDLLKNTDFFNLLTPDEFSLLLKESIFIKTSKNYFLIKDNEENSAYYIILKGAVQSTITQDNRVAKLSVLSPIHIVSNISHIDGNTGLINYITCEQAFLLKITSSHIQHIHTTHPLLWFKLFNFIFESFLSLEQAANKLIIRLNSELYNR